MGSYFGSFAVVVQGQDGGSLFTSNLVFISGNFPEFAYNEGVENSQYEDWPESQKHFTDKNVRFKDTRRSNGSVFLALVQI